MPYLAVSENLIYTRTMPLYEINNFIVIYICLIKYGNLSFTSLEISHFVGLKEISRYNKIAKEKIT